MSKDLELVTALGLYHDQEMQTLCARIAKGESQIRELKKTNRTLETKIEWLQGELEHYRSKHKARLQEDMNKLRH
tara:strand:- start:501 stop:725 length:225 start_codon:yes stop_codon:yes gene_type:complete